MLYKVKKTVSLELFLVVVLLFPQYLESALLYIIGSVKWPRKVKVLAAKQMIPGTHMERTNSQKLSPTDICTCVHTQKPTCGSFSLPS